jgi:hypothetical protein
VGLATIFYWLRFEISIFVYSYDSLGYGGGIRPCLHTGMRTKNGKTTAEQIKKKSGRNEKQKNILCLSFTKMVPYIDHYHVLPKRRSHPSSQCLFFSLHLKVQFSKFSNQPRARGLRIFCLGFQLVHNESEVWKQGN